MKIKFAILFALAFFISSCAIFAELAEEEISFSNGKLKLGGTLTVPKGNGKFPLVILVTGSGQQNRDEEILGLKPFKVIADTLSAAGYAVFRYDDRGVGASKNNQGDLDGVTLRDFAQDAYSAVQTLKGHSKVNPAKIGILGHSEGGIIAQILAADHPDEINFIIMMAAPTITGAQISRYQVEQTNLDAGLSEAAIDTVLKYQDKITEAIISNQSAIKLKDLLYETNLITAKYLPEEKRKFITNEKEYAESMAKQMYEMLNTPYIREYFTYNPADALKRIQCPTLAIFGEKDRQVPVRLNVSPLEYTFYDKQHLIEIVTIPNANHLFQEAYSGSVTEYATLEKKFEKSFLPTIIAWLNKNVKK